MNSTLVSTFDSCVTEKLLRLLEHPLPRMVRTNLPSSMVGGTTIGLVRRENQDRHLLVRYTPGVNGCGFRLAAIADGVGSLAKSGQSASAAIASFVGFIVTELEEWNPLLGTPDWDQILRTAVQHANRHVRALTADQGATTLSAVILPDRQPAFGIHVGDSKIYGLDRAFRCSQLSADQNVAAQLQALGVMNSPTSDTYSALERQTSL